MHVYDGLRPLCLSRRITSNNRAGTLRLRHVQEMFLNPLRDGDMIVINR